MSHRHCARSFPRAILRTLRAVLEGLVPSRFSGLSGRSNSTASSPAYSFVYSSSGLVEISGTGRCLIGIYARTLRFLFLIAIGLVLCRGKTGPTYPRKLRCSNAHSGRLSALRSHVPFRRNARITSGSLRTCYFQDSGPCSLLSLRAIPIAGKIASRSVRRFDFQLRSLSRSFGCAIRPKHTARFRAAFARTASAALVRESRDFRARLSSRVRAGCEK